MLGILPAETLLEILTFLPLPDLNSVQLTCKDWNRLVRTNEEYLFRNWFRASRDDRADFSEVELAKGKHALKWLEAVTTWKGLARRHILLERSWTGKEKAVIRSLPLASHMVHRFKVDEVEQTLLISNNSGSLIGGLKVADIASDEILWSLPPRYVDAYAHVEYDSPSGYLAFNRSSHEIDLWQRSTDPPHPLSRPSQLQSMLHANEGGQPQERGKMVPVAILNHAGQTRAFRLVYPTLLVASQEAGTAYVWDIPTLTCEEINVGPGWTPWGQQWIYYVEVSQTHVFVCSDNQVKVFDRADGSCILEFPPTNSILNSPARQQMISYSLDRNPSASLPTPDAIGRNISEKPLYAMTACELIRPTRTRKEAQDADLETEDVDWHPDLEAFAHAGGLFAFSAVHVSPNGKDFIAVHTKECLYYVRDFAKGVEGLEDRTTILRFSSASIQNLAFDGRRALVTTSKGVYILTPDLSWKEGDEGDPFMLHMVAPFTDRYALTHLSCAQLTETAIWLTWHPGVRRFHMNAEGIPVEVNGIRNAPLIHYVDFTYDPEA
ncbi:hypothetical protein CALVIDRAFT_542513 [Calocera viscosa TUFC12733]|uniref:F-box domain-containing protein n=1 Tax=Calocera viscosa (strain TUFC12733) TaxID=1330018 RepID=A0A167GKB5_CALVF|nr:hypothetical protein CALVIDRAFT_542513 [Calocera viscosa TUFC12733]